MMVESSCEANQRDPTLQSHQIELCAMHAGTLSAMLTNTNNMCIYVVAGFLTDSILHWKTNPATRQQDDPGCLTPHLAQFDLSAASHKYKTSTPLFAFYSSDFWHFVLLSIGKRSGAHWEHNVSKSLPCILQKNSAQGSKRTILVPRFFLRGKKNKNMTNIWISPVNVKSVHLSVRQSVCCAGCQRAKDDKLEGRHAKKQLVWVVDTRGSWRVHTLQLTTPRWKNLPMQVFTNLYNLHKIYMMLKNMVNIYKQAFYGSWLFWGFEIPDVFDLFDTFVDSYIIPCVFIWSFDVLKEKCSINSHWNGSKDIKFIGLVQTFDS